MKRPLSLAALALVATPIASASFSSLDEILQDAQEKVKEITIKVKATRLPSTRANEGGATTKLDKGQINKFINTVSGDTKQLTRGQKGVAEDSAGQQHVRGEHTDITYVVDGVPLPDTLSGRSGSVLLPATIESLEIILGGFAPEFGGQTAAVLNATTTPGARRFHADGALQGGQNKTLNGDFTTSGPLGAKGSFVLNLSGTETSVGSEPLQPDHQDAHDRATSRTIFAKFKYAPHAGESIDLTISHSPDSLEIANRTGLDSTYASVGEGYGFQGLRNADGSRPDVNSSNSGLLGAQSILLPSQQAAGQSIFQHETSEFATLAWSKRLRESENLQLALTLLHSGQDVENDNPLVDPANLPIDNSIEYSPTAHRNVHHVQLTGTWAKRAGAHRLKTGFLLDAQSGKESYQINADSQLSLDALYALAPNLAPTGGTLTGAVDIDGNPVYLSSSNVGQALNLERKGTYKAAFLQDTWTAGRLITNYGVRADWYVQNQNLGADSVSDFLLGPRLNFQYRWNAKTTVRASYNRLLNIPPLAQGAVVGQALKSERISQYDLGIDRKIAPNQTISAAYYYKDIRNQVDVGLLVPGSQIGIYSGVNFDRGGVHGLELGYDLVASKGLDAYLNYTFSAAKPNGKDNTGVDVPDYNDHDQRHTVGAGMAYTWASGATASLTENYGSGLASSVVFPGGGRTPRSTTDFSYSSGDRLFSGHGGLRLDVSNVFDNRKVINFQSAFSGTRFQIGRVISLSANFKL